MSELKVYHCNEWHNEYTEFYLKSEADKVIAELKDDVTYWKKVAKKNMDDNVAMARERAKAFESEHRRKHKQCVAMARWCESKVYHIRRTPLCDMGEHEGWQHDDEFWQRWHKRWLELAEQFKPNSTAPEENSDG